MGYTAVGVAETWLSSVLGADQASGTLGALGLAGVYSSLAPQGASYPLLIFAYLAGLDTNAMAAVRVITVLQYALKVVDAVESIGVLDQMQYRISQLLQAQRAALSVGTIHGCQRTMPPQVLAAPDAGKSYRQLIARYEIHVGEN